MAYLAWPRRDPGHLGRIFTDEMGRAYLAGWTTNDQIGTATTDLAEVAEKSE